MSSQPTGWQTPRTNWKSADVPLPTDINRIEGNIQAIESGSRTLDPSQAPTGNTGSLRQLLDWFANRLKAITGAANWYDSPIITLAGAKGGLDNLQSALDTHKSSGDHDGRYYTKSQLNTSGGGGQVHWNNVTSKPSIPSNPVPVTQLKRAQGSSSAVLFAVQQYAFASPTHATHQSWSLAVVLGAVNSQSSTSRQWVQAYRNSGNWSDSDAQGLVTRSGYASTVTWDYLTASGHPQVWAEVDGVGEIIALWEAEDPADPDFPDEPPIEVSKDDEGNPISGRLVLPLLMPDERAISTVRDRLLTASRGQWLTQSRFATLGEPVSIHRSMVDEQLRERALEIPDDIRAVFTDIKDYDRRHWYLQLWLRQASRLLYDHRPSTLIPLYRDMFRVDRRTGRLVLR